MPSSATAVTVHINYENALKGRYAFVYGSEFKLYRGALGTTVHGIRNEDLGALTWSDRSFDFVLSLDVFEHVPDVAACFGEIFRCLKPGGRLLFTAPFRLSSSQTLVRASVGASGEIVHLVEPEYHGGNLADPGRGILCFRHFGWDVMQQLEGVGFCDAEVWLFWSRELGYLGGTQSVITAIKPER
jgi:SAM-dependent methyltransferase